jgi:hypothetical protein
MTNEDDRKTAADTLRSERERRERAEMRLTEIAKAVERAQPADLIGPTYLGTPVYFPRGAWQQIKTATDPSSPHPEPGTVEWRARWAVNDVGGYIYSPWLPTEEDASGWVSPMSGRIAWLERRTVSEPRRVEEEGR